MVQPETATAEAPPAPPPDSPLEAPPSPEAEKPEAAEVVAAPEETEEKPKTEAEVLAELAEWREERATKVKEEAEESAKTREAEADRRARQSERDSLYRQQAQNQQAQQQAAELRQQRRIARENRVTAFLREKNIEDVDAGAVAGLMEQDDAQLEGEATQNYGAAVGQFLATFVSSHPAYQANQDAIQEIWRRPANADWMNAPDALIELGRLQGIKESEGRIKVEAEKLAKVGAERLFQEKMNAVKTEPKETPKGAPTAGGTDEERLQRIVDGQPLDGDAEWYEKTHGRSSRRR